MPVTKSAQKRVRVNERKRLGNKPIRSQCKSNVTKAERLIFLGELEAAREAVAVAISSLDKAAEKGIIHPNNAARRKSRLVQKLNQAQAQAPAPAVTKPKAAETKPKAAKAKPKAAKAKPKVAEAKPKAVKAKPKAAKPKPKTAKKPSPKKLDSEG